MNRHVGFKSISKFNEEILLGLGLDNFSKSFLIDHGLPADSAPFLSFAENNRKQFEGINRITVKYTLENTLLSKYVSIGSDGNGNEIVIDTLDNCKIKILDHEFDFKEEFMNSSISHLGSSLNAMTRFVSDVQNKYGSEGFIDSLFSLHEVHQLEQELKKADPKCLNNGNFWHIELRMLLEGAKPI